MDLKDTLVAVAAAIGAVLGVINLVRNYLADAERLRLAVWSGETDGHPRIEVVNVSQFPVTVMTIAHVYPEGQVADVVLETIRGDPDALPARIEARGSRTFSVSRRETIAAQVHKPKYTFARTALGSVVTNERRLTRWWRRTKERLHMKQKDL